MLETLGFDSLDALADAIVPSEIRMQGELAIGPERSEHELVAELRGIAEQNQVFRSFIGTGYYGTITPQVIARNILENPGWYTQYTPYQAEISQGRLEVLLCFQTLIADLTGLPLANASMLDEGTAAAEGMALCNAVTRGKKNGFYASADCHPQTLAVLRTRADAVGIDLHVGSLDGLDFEALDLCGVLVQYPTTDGRIEDYSGLAARAHDAGALVVAATDLLAVAVLRPPGEFGADVAIGSSQRFGVPMGYGGPHAGFLATREEYKRHVPGRLIGVSKDREGRTAYRLALQTREQHIRRDRATSNICTAQVLLAIMAGVYGMYHGPKGLRRIAERVHGWTAVLATGLRELGHDLGAKPFFDTLKIRLDSQRQRAIAAAARAKRMNLRIYSSDDSPGSQEIALGISLDETTCAADVADLLEVFAEGRAVPELEVTIAATNPETSAGLQRTSEYLSHPWFSLYHAEHEMLRYLNRMQAKDLSLTTSMIPLGSCTMKLNASSEMVPISWPEFAALHPFAPLDQAQGYSEMMAGLQGWLANITGFAAVSLQPNSGAQGEYAGLLVIRAYQEARGQGHRRVCLIPTSAHGTNPASAVMAGFKVVAVKCDDDGNIDVADLKAKAEKHADELAALMITYPSTHGVFESAVREICDAVHAHGGQVYLDGANMNAQVGLCRPGDFGGDVVHLNLHKTFCIPHGGGGPGMGPIAVAEHLVPYLPGHPSCENADSQIGPVSAAPHGSPSILPISWVYIALMGSAGLKRASQVAILNANYMARRLESHYDIVFRGSSGHVAHEFIIDCRGFKKLAGITIDDIAKRLMDYGFHAPTMSWPVAGTLMIEPTESECRAELDRLCDALIAIRGEIEAIAEGRSDREDNALKGAPHTAQMIAGEWGRAYSREQAAYPAAWLREHKYWPPVSRIDNAFGDRHLVCTCPPMDAYETED